MKKMKGGCGFLGCGRPARPDVSKNELPRKNRSTRNRSASPPLRASPVTTSLPLPDPLLAARRRFNQDIEKSYHTSPPPSRLPQIAQSSRLPRSEYPVPFSLSSPLPPVTARNSRSNNQRRETASTWVPMAHAAARAGASNKRILEIAEAGVKAATGNPNSSIPALLRRGGATRKRKSKHAQ